MTDMTQGFSLLLTGMLTVFIVLAIIVLLARLVILISNRYTPAVAEKRGLRKATAAPQIIAVLSAAIDQTSNGKAHITHIEKL